MLFRQLFDHTSHTYTYLLAERRGGEALIIDPVLENTAQYVRLLEELDAKLVMAVDTHIHADHVTAMGELHRETTPDPLRIRLPNVRLHTGKTPEAEPGAFPQPGSADGSRVFVPLPAVSRQMS
mgnify:CR=1 FL=1